MPEPPAATGGERIAKRLARAGLCSRREAERWIAEGRVAVDGKPLPAPEATRLWRYHKPRGLICAERDPQGRASVFDRLPPALPRVVSVGRLDVASEGLLLLTNDGALARTLELPATGWLRRYRVRVFGRPDPEGLAALAGGVTVDGVSYGPIEAALDRRQGGNAWLTLSLREGRNREVRNVMTYLGLSVNRLIRVAFGPFQLGKLAPGAVREVPRRVLADQLGSPTAGRARAHRRR